MNKLIAFYTIVLAYVTGLSMGNAIDHDLYVVIALFSLGSIALKSLGLLIKWVRENKEADIKVMQLHKQITEMFEESDRKHREFLAEFSNIPNLNPVRAESFEERLARRKRKVAMAA